MTLTQFKAECRVGHLVEWRLRPINEVGEMRSLERARADAMEHGGIETVVCVDWRQGDVLRPEVADALTEAWHKRALCFRRSAILLSKDRPTFNLQIERVIRSVDVANRRSFREVPALLAWLSEVLTEEELRRASEFLEESGA